MFRPYLFLFSLLAGCSSVAWSAPPAGVPTQWRHYHLFAGEHALVLACDGDAALEVHERAAAAAATIEQCTGRVPARGLLIALSAADPLPIADPAAYGDAMRRWNPGRPTSASSFSLRQRSGRAVDVDPAVVMHLVATGVPKEDDTLALPAALLDAGSFVAIVPTDSCLETTCSTLFDAAAAAEGVSSWEIALVSVVAGHPATLMSEQAGKAVDAALYDAWLLALGVDEATAAAVRTRAGLPGHADDGAEPAVSAAELEQARQKFARSLVRPHGAMPFFLARRVPCAEVCVDRTEARERVALAVSGCCKAIDARAGTHRCDEKAGRGWIGYPTATLDQP